MPSCAVRVERLIFCQASSAFRVLIRLVSTEVHLTPGLLEMCAIITEVCDSVPFLGNSFSASAPLPARYQTCRPPQVPEAMQRQWKTKSRTSGSSAMPSPLASVLL